MAVDYTYIKRNKAFSVEAVREATGVPITASLTNPDELVVFTLDKPLDERELEPLDAYMADQGYQRNV